MKKLLVFALLGVSAPAQDQTPAPEKTAAKKTEAKKTEAKKTEAKKTAPKAAQPLTIPADAVAKPDGTYSYTDKAGKKWIFSKGPFGVSRIEDMQGLDSGFSTIPKEKLIQTTDQGDTVKFERQTPFGPTKWEKKKTEMTAEEKGIFESQHPQNQTTGAKPQ